MDYETLFNNLIKTPPLGWRVIRCVSAEQGGVYFWPNILPPIMEPRHVEPDWRLGTYSLLFEFHVIPSNNRARILARARFHGEAAENDLRWIVWRDLAIKHCGATKVQEKGNPKNTKSVGLWRCGTFKKIDATLIANAIRNYLKNPPTSLTCFIGHLGQSHL